MQSCKSQFSKVAKKGKLLRMFSLLCSLTKNDVEFLPVEISSEKVRVNKVNFLTIKITSKKVIGNNVDSLIIKLHRKKYVKKGGYFGQRNYFKKSTWKQSVFFDQQNYIEKCTWKQRGFLTIEITSKKVRGNDAEICRNLHFDVKTIQRGVPVGYSQLDFAVRWVLLHLCSGRAACPIYWMLQVLHVSKQIKLLVWHEMFSPEWLIIV